MATVHVSFEQARLFLIAFRVAAKPVAPKRVDLPSDYLQDVSKLRKDLQKILAKLQAAVQSGNKDKHRQVMDEYAKRLDEHQRKYPGDDWGYETDIMGK